MFSDKLHPFLYKSIKLARRNDQTMGAELTLVREPFECTDLTVKLYGVLAQQVFGHPKERITEFGFKADGEPTLLEHFVDVTQGPGLGLQKAAFRLDPAMEPECVAEVRVLKYRATRCTTKDAPDWARLSVVIQLPLDTTPARHFVINHFQHAIYIESSDIEPALPLEDEVSETEADIGGAQT